MAENSVPVGFKTMPYPNLVTGKDDTMYVCQDCQPPWDTFDEEQAKAHTTAGIHRPALDAQLTRPR